MTGYEMKQYAAKLTSEKLLVESKAIAQTAQRYFERYTKTGSSTTLNSLAALDTYARVLRTEITNRQLASARLGAMLTAMI